MNCYVETLSASFKRCLWLAVSEDEGKEMARRLSIAAAEDPTYPHVFSVVDQNSHKTIDVFYQGRSYTLPRKAH